MRRLLRLVLVSLLGAAGCASSGAAPLEPANAAAAEGGGSPRMAFGGGDGSSCAQAVLVHARNEMAGGRAEYAWLAAKYPGYERRMQSLTRCNGKAADVLEIRAADGRVLEVYFDISEYFGHF